MKGQNLRILIGSPAKCVAFSTSCTYHLSNSLEDSSTKDDEGGFQKQEVTGCAGDISCDALYSVETDSNGINGQDALDLVLAGQEVDVEFSPTSGTAQKAVPPFYPARQKEIRLYFPCAKVRRKTCQSPLELIQCNQIATVGKNACGRPDCYIVRGVSCGRYDPNSDDGSFPDLYR